MAQRGRDGVLRVAFGVCRKCQRFPHYVSQGKLMCGHCRHVIPLPEPGDNPDTKKGCYSTSIPYAVENNELVVRSAAITEGFGKWYQAPQTVN